MIKICLIGDYLLTRNAYVQALSTNDEIECIADFDKLSDCVRFLEHGSADVVLIDIKLNESGFEAITKLKRRFTQIKFIIMTDQDEQENIIKVISLGAAYVLKNMLLDEFVNIILTVLKGNMFICADAVGILTSIFQEKLEFSRKTELYNLTEREKEILIHISRGESNQEIGQALALSAFTVKNYVSKIIEKLEVKTRTQATAKAIQYGLVN